MLNQARCLQRLVGRCELQEPRAAALPSCCARFATYPPCLKSLYMEQPCSGSCKLRLMQPCHPSHREGEAASLASASLTCNRLCRARIYRIILITKLKLLISSHPTGTVAGRRWQEAGRGCPVCTALAAVRAAWLFNPCLPVLHLAPDQKCFQGSEQ